MSDLLPCPFCGSKPKIRHIGNAHTESRRVAVTCSKTGCTPEMRVGAIYHDMDWCEENAIKAWNTRTPDPRIAELETALQYYADTLSKTSLCWDNSIAWGIGHDHGKRAHAALAVKGDSDE